MDYIILDIEFNGRKFASELPMEVIEIGAVRLNSALEQTDEFSALIKPIYFSKLNSFIKKKPAFHRKTSMWQAVSRRSFVNSRHGFAKATPSCCSLGAART